MVTNRSERSRVVRFARLIPISLNRNSGAFPHRSICPNIDQLTNLDCCAMWPQQRSMVYSYTDVYQICIH